MIENQEANVMLSGGQRVRVAIPIILPIFDLQFCVLGTVGFGHIIPALAGNLTLA